MRLLQLMRTRSKNVTLPAAAIVVSFTLVGCMPPKSNSSAEGGGASDVALNGTQDPRFSKENIKFQQQLEQQKLAIEAKNADTAAKKASDDLFNLEKKNANDLEGLKFSETEETKRSFHSDDASVKQAEAQQDDFLDRLMSDVAPAALEALPEMAKAQAEVKKAEAQETRVKLDGKRMDRELDIAELDAVTRRMEAKRHMKEEDLQAELDGLKTEIAGLNAKKYELDMEERIIKKLDENESWDPYSEQSEVAKFAISNPQIVNPYLGNKTARTTRLGELPSARAEIDGLLREKAVDAKADEALLGGRAAPQSYENSFNAGRPGVEGQLVSDWFLCVTDSGEPAKAFSASECNATGQSATTKINIGDLLADAEALRLLIWNIPSGNDRSVVYGNQGISDKIGALRKKIQGDLSKPDLDAVDQARLMKMSNLLDAMVATHTNVETNLKNQKLDSSDIVTKANADFRAKAIQIRKTKPSPQGALAFMSDLGNSGRRSAALSWDSGGTQRLVSADLRRSNDFTESGNSNAVDVYNLCAGGTTC